LNEPQDSPAVIEVSKIGWVGPLTIVCSVGAVLVVRIVAVAMLRPDPAFTPLGWAFPIIDTAVLTTGAVLVFGAIASTAATPIRTFRRTAGVIVTLSLLPALATAFSASWGGSWPNSLALVMMHLAAWAVCVRMLTTLTVRRPPDASGERNLLQRNVAYPTSRAVSSVAVFGLFALLMFPIHELAHYSTYRLLGIPLRMTLNTASPSDQALRRPIAELAGPLLNLGVAAIAAGAYLVGGARQWWLAELALAATMMRLVIYVLVVGAAVVTGSGLSLGNDEPIAARLWGLPSLSFVAAFAMPFGWIARTVAIAAWGRWAFPLVLRGAVMLAVGILVGNVLDSWLFPHR
jgi:hypothetical protein